MPDYHVRVYQRQLLEGEAEVLITAETPAAAAEIVLTAANGDPDDETGERRYHLPDGRVMQLDPEDCVIGGRIYCKVLDAAQRQCLGTFGEIASCDAPDDGAASGLALSPEEAVVLVTLLRTEIMDTVSNHKAELLNRILRKLGG